VALTVAFDCDGTLLNLDGDPKYKVLDLLRWFLENSDAEVIIWSGGGTDYAKTVIRRLGLAGRVRVGNKFCQPVDIAVDDMGDMIAPDKLQAKVIIRV